MSLFLNTLKRGQVGIAVCDRCKMKMSIEELGPDPNFPGLRVCRGCTDVFDPWRLPPRSTENITLRYPRPDTALSASILFSVGVGGVMGSFQVGELVIGQLSQVQATFVSLVGSTMTFNESNGGLTFTEGEIIIGNTSGATAQVVTQYGDN